MVYGPDLGQRIAVDFPVPKKSNEVSKNQSLLHHFGIAEEEVENNYGSLRRAKEKDKEKHSEKIEEEKAERHSALEQIAQESGIIRNGGLLRKLQVRLELRKPYEPEIPLEMSQETEARQLVYDLAEKVNTTADRLDNFKDNLNRLNRQYSELENKEIELEAHDIQLRQEMQHYEQAIGREREGLKLLLRYHSLSEEEKESCHEYIREIHPDDEEEREHMLSMSDNEEILSVLVKHYKEDIVREEEEMHKVSESLQKIKWEYKACLAKKDNIYRIMEQAKGEYDPAINSLIKLKEDYEHAKSSVDTAINILDLHSIRTESAELSGNVQRVVNNLISRVESSRSETEAVEEVYLNDNSRAY